MVCDFEDVSFVKTMNRTM